MAITIFVVFPDMNLPGQWKNYPAFRLETRKNGWGGVFAAKSTFLVEHSGGAPSATFAGVD